MDTLCEVCKALAAVKSDRSREKLTDLSSALNTLKANVSKVGIKVASEMETLESACGVQDLSQKLYLESFMRFKADCIAMVSGAEQVLVTGSEGMVTELDTRVKDQVFKMMQSSGSSSTPVIDRAAIDFMGGDVRTLCSVPSHRLLFYCRRLDLFLRRWHSAYNNHTPCHGLAVDRHANL